MITPFILGNQSFQGKISMILFCMAIENCPFNSMMKIQLARFDCHHCTCYIPIRMIPSFLMFESRLLKLKHHLLKVEFHSSHHCWMVKSWFLGSSMLNHDDTTIFHGVWWLNHHDATIFDGFWWFRQTVVLRQVTQRHDNSRRQMLDPLQAWYFGSRCNLAWCGLAMFSVLASFSAFLGQ